MARRRRVRRATHHRRGTIRKHKVLRKRQRRHLAKRHHKAARKRRILRHRIHIASKRKARRAKRQAKKKTRRGFHLYRAAGRLHAHKRSTRHVVHQWHLMRSGTYRARTRKHP